MSKKMLYALLIISTFAFVNIACSSKNIKPLTELELAQRLIEEQKLEKEAMTDLPIKINLSQNGKAVIDKALDLQLEVSTSKPVAFINIILHPRDGVELKPKWLFLERKQHTIKLDKIVVDQLYRDSVSVIPTQKGLLGLDIYTVTEIDNVKKAKRQTLYFSIGNPLQEKQDVGEAAQ